MSANSQGSVQEVPDLRFEETPARSLLSGAISRSLAAMRSLRATQDLRSKHRVLRSGALYPNRVGVAAWNEDFRRLIQFAQLTLRLQKQALPKRTYILFASLIDPQAKVSLPQARAAYVPSALARDAIRAFAHSGAIQKPLISLAGTKDILIPPEFHALGYAQAVAAAGKAHLHRLYLVENATHLDTFTAFGYALQAHLPFTWAAFAQLERIVEQDATEGLGRTRIVTSPEQIG